MKNFICLLLVFTCLFCFAACNANTENLQTPIKETESNSTTTPIDNSTNTTNSNNEIKKEQDITDVIDKLKQELKEPLVLKTDKFVLYATVIEIKSDSLLVETIFNNNDKFFSVDVKNQIKVSIARVKLPYDIKVGDTVRITYDGKMLTSYPAKITNVYEIIKYDSEIMKDFEIEFLQDNVEDTGF